jgi:hypothetical protein
LRKQLQEVVTLAKELRKEVTEVKATPRKGIQHVYGGEEGKYSMAPEDFLEIIKFIKDSNKGHLNTANTRISEKADGFSLKFGLDENNKFFIESSHSDPIYDEGKFREFTVGKKGQTDPVTEGYEDILKQLKNNKEIQEYLKSINTPSGIKIQVEAFYLPIGNVSGNDLVKFVATWYKKEKLGNWATFIVINVMDGKGRPLPSDKVAKIKEDLKNLSTKELKFDYGDLPDFKDIDLTPEIKKVELFINKIEKEYGQKIDDVIKNPSRQRSVLEQKRKIKQEMLKLQHEFSRKLGDLIKTGKFGDEYEGLVFELANGILFKVVSDRFKEAKKAYNQEYKK